MFISNEFYVLGIFDGEIDQKEQVSYLMLYNNADMLKIWITDHVTQETGYKIG